MKKLISFLPLLICSCTSAPDTIAPGTEQPLYQTIDTISTVKPIDTSAKKNTEIANAKPAAVQQKEPKPAPTSQIRKTETTQTNEKAHLKDTIPLQTPSPATLTKIKTAEEKRRDSIIMERLKRTWK
jgi:hypothetical protein